MTMPPVPPPAPSAGMRLSTADVAPRERLSWLRDVIGREYAHVEIRPPADGLLFNEMTIYPWAELRLSAIRSGALTIERLPQEVHRISQDAYFAVMLLSGGYLLEQAGREVFLSPGDITLYDATRPHRIHCPRDFAKLIVSIPRPVLRERIPGIEHCTALRIPGAQGMGAVASGFLRASAAAAPGGAPHAALAAHALDLLTLAVTEVRPAHYTLSRSRSLSLYRVKDFVQRHLAEPGLDAVTVARAVALSPRYINDLFRDEQTSLMRYLWQCRLERCRRDLLAPALAGQRISDIAFRWGFNDLAHFSRAFRQRYGCSPRAYRQRG